MLLDQAQRDPNSVAVDDGIRRRTWSELVDRATRLAHGVQELGVRPDEHLGLFLGNRIEFVELALAAQLGGWWLVPLNTHLTADEVAYVCADASVRAVVADREVPGWSGELVAVGPQLDALAAQASDAPFSLEARPGGRLHYTSGTTGRPKGVRRSQPATLGEALEATATSGPMLGLDGSGPHLVTGPMYHAAPFGFALFDLHAGAQLVLMDRWDERRFLGLVQERSIVHTHLVPTMCVRLLRLPDEDRAGFDPSGLRLVLHGAAPISAAVKRRMIEWFGPCFVEYWGTSEGGVFTLIDGDDWLAHPGSVGRPIAGFEVRAVDAELDGRPATAEPRFLPAGQQGVLYTRKVGVRSPFAYHEAPEKTAAAHLGDSEWFTMGDVGTVDEAGYVWLADRATNMVITGGMNVYPAEVEAVLLEHPAVADVAVFGVPDEEWGEAVKAAVELRSGWEASPELEADLITHARAHLATYKAPRSVDFEQALPRQPNGKLYVRELKARYWDGRSI